MRQLSRGANAKTGALGVFLEVVKDGTVKPGSYLLIENLDRLTRADVPEAQELFTGIIRRGITLVTLFDQRSYSAESVTNAPMDWYIRSSRWYGDTRKALPNREGCSPRMSGSA